MTPNYTAQISSFVAQVRNHLAYLGDQTVEDLTDGLAEQLADQASAEGWNYSPADAAKYADDLRSAANLPPQTPTIEARRVKVWRGFAKQVSYAYNAVRPAWWLLRGYLLGQMLMYLKTHQLTVLPDGRFNLILDLFMIIVSFYFGKSGMGKKWLTNLSLVRKLSEVAINATSVIVLLACMVLGQEYYNEWSTLKVFVDNSALVYGGQYVGDITAYDSHGAVLPMSKLESQYGFTIYQKDWKLVTTKEFQPVLGMSQHQAQRYLMTHGHNLVAFAFERYSDVAKGRVAQVVYESTTGGMLVKVIISSGK